MGIKHSIFKETPLLLYQDKASLLFNISFVNGQGKGGGGRELSPSFLSPVDREGNLLFTPRRGVVFSFPGKKSINYREFPSKGKSRYLSRISLEGKRKFNRVFPFPGSRETGKINREFPFLLGTFFRCFHRQSKSPRALLTVSGPSFRWCRCSLPGLKWLQNPLP